MYNTRRYILIVMMQDEQKWIVKNSYAPTFVRTSYIISTADAILYVALLYIWIIY